MKSGPSACEADVITTTLPNLNLIQYKKKRSLFYLKDIHNQNIMHKLFLIILLLRLSHKILLSIKTVDYLIRKKWSQFGNTYKK